jgi:hypothetical protein
VAQWESDIIENKSNPKYPGFAPQRGKPSKILRPVFLCCQFVELKGSVFKKFDKNNLFQVSCSDVRERFHLFALLFIVVVQTMKEYGWREGPFTEKQYVQICLLHCPMYLLFKLY